MKICFVIEHYSPHIGGVEIAFEEYAKRLSDRGHVVRIVTSNSGGITGERVAGNVKIYYFNCKSFFGHPLLPKNKIEEHIQWADIVHTSTITAALPAVLLCHKHTKPCLLMVHEVLGKRWFSVERNPFKAIGFFLFERYMLNRKYTLWQTISQATQNDLIRLGIPKIKTRLVHHGIDATIWHHAVSKKDLCSLFKLSPEHQIFLYNGRPGKTKGVLLLLQALSLIQSKLPPKFIFGFILSREPKKERLLFEHMVKKYHLETCVRIQNSLPYSDLPGYRKDAFAFIVPSLTEGFGFSAAETAALQVPLIVSDTGSLPEVVSGKVLFFKNGNADDLAHKILLAIENRFYSIPEKKFNWDTSVTGLIQIYQELL